MRRGGAAHRGRRVRAGAGVPAIGVTAFPGDARRRPEATHFASFLTTPVYPEGLVRAIRGARESKAASNRWQSVICLRTENTDEVE